MDGIEGSVESSNSCWSVNISAIAYVVRKLEHAAQKKNNENTCFILIFFQCKKKNSK